MATSLDALEALLQFREGVPKKIIESRRRPPMPVPNPLDPTQPHVIEGDTPPPATTGAFFESEPRRIPAAKPRMSPVVTTVPNPLAKSLDDKHTTPTHHPMSAPISAAKLFAPSSAPKTIFCHGFVMAYPIPMPVSSEAEPEQTLGVEVRSDKIRDALNSKPQRGKKRQNLNKSERLELTRTRNREHAKSTRMKQRARLEELIETEKKYLALKEKEKLFNTREELLVQFVENVGNPSAQQRIDNCPHVSTLMELASGEIAKPEFTATGSAATRDDNSGMVRVSAHGRDLVSGGPKTLQGVICVDFTPGSAHVCNVSLYWSSPLSSGGMSPSISVLSLNT